MVKRVRYFLNENYKAGDALMLEALVISRAKEGAGSQIVQSWLPILDRYVRTKQTPKGILDWELVDITTQPPKVLESSAELFAYPIEKYTFDKLMSKQREDIVKIAKALGIPSAHTKSDDFLRRRILEESSKMVEEEPSIEEAVTAEAQTSEQPKKGKASKSEPIMKKEEAAVIVTDDESSFNVEPVMAPDSTQEK